MSLLLFLFLINILLSHFQVNFFGWFLSHLILKTPTFVLCFILIVFIMLLQVILDQYWFWFALLACGISLTLVQRLQLIMLDEPLHLFDLQFTYPVFLFLLLEFPLKLSEHLFFIFYLFIPLPKFFSLLLLLIFNFLLDILLCFFKSVQLFLVHLLILSFFLLSNIESFFNS